jgi:hypothetical protein
VPVVDPRVRKDMSDRDRLLAAFASGRLLAPSPDHESIVDLSLALATLAGAEGVRSTPGSSRIAGLIGPAGHLVFILADGVGMSLVEALGEGSFLRAHVATELRTVFPSTTAVALTSLATGEWPNVHGVTGWWTHVPEIGTVATILPYVRRFDERPLLDLGADPAEVFPTPALMERMSHDVLALFPRGIADSVYSTYFSGGRPRSGYGTLREAMDMTLSYIARATRPTYVYIYTSLVDAQCHRHGVGRPEAASALRELEEEVERLSGGLRGRARVVLSADHSFLDIPAAGKRRLRPTPALMNGLRVPPSGDVRALYFHVRDGLADRLRWTLRASLGERFMLLETDEAVSLGLFGPGPGSPHARRRLGDLVAISDGADVVAYEPANGSSPVMSMASHHSGLTPEEMRVPLVLS